MGRRFGFLWASYAVSAAGTWLAFDAFPLVAILVLHAGPGAVSALAAAGPAAGAVLAAGLGPWLARRRSRSVMVTADLVRCVAVLSVPVAYAAGVLALPQMLAVAVVVAAADVGFSAAGGALLRQVVAPGDLLVANGRFEATTWTATALGPPLGGLAIGVLGPVVTVVANGVSFLLSAAGLGAIGSVGPAERGDRGPARLLDGWRAILADPVLRRLYANTVLVNGLILASAPLLAVLMLGRLGFAPWQYGVAFGVPCVGGLAGARLAPRLVERYGRGRVLRVAGTVRACWPLGLAFVAAGTAGLVLVVALQTALVGSIGVFNPVLATVRLERAPAGRVTPVLAAWSVSGKLAVAVATALGGLLADVTGPRAVIALAGLLLLATPLLLRSEVLEQVGEGA